MLQLTKAQSLFFVTDAFLITEALTWFLSVYVMPMLWKVYPGLPVYTPTYLGAASMFFGSWFLYSMAKHTVRIKFDRTAFITVAVGLVTTCVQVYVSHPLFSGSGRPNFAGWPVVSVFMSLFLSIVLSPILEEVLVRGCYFEVLRRSWGDRSALKISTVLFVVPHLIWGGALYLHPLSLLLLTLASVLYTYLYIVGGLVPAIAAHMLWNFYVACLS